MRERAGLYMDYTTTAAVTAGVPIVVGKVVGIPNVTAAANADGTLVSLACEGVYELPKATGAITQGAAVYLTKDGKITTTDTGNTLAGVAWTAAQSADATVMVKINA